MQLRLLLTLGFLVLAVPGWSATAFVQGWSNQNFSGTTLGVASGSNVTAGNLIVCAAWYSSSTTFTSITDSLGNTYNAVHTDTTEASSSLRGTAAYAMNIGGGANTVTLTVGASVQKRLACHEVSGAATASALDKSAANAQQDPGTGTDAVTSTSVTTTTDGQYIFGATTDWSQNATPVQGTGFTARQNTPTSLRSEDQIQTSAGSIAATFTAGNANSDFVTFILTFKAAGGGGGGASPLPRRVLWFH